MPVKMTKTAAESRTRSLREGKVRKEFWLNPSLLRRAQQDLGATTEREAFRRELRKGARTYAQMEINRYARVSTDATLRD